MTLLLGFTLAAFNLDRIRSFRAKDALDENGQPIEKRKQTRAKRRVGTWAAVIEPTASPPECTTLMQEGSAGRSRFIASAHVRPSERRVR